MLLHSFVGLGLAGLIGKLHNWDEAAIFFDGTSLGSSGLDPLKSQCRLAPLLPNEHFVMVG